MALVAYALTTVETLCGELGIAVPAAASAAERDLERRIAVASSAIANYCNREFGTAETTEKVAGFGTLVLQLPRYPVTEVESVTLDGTEVGEESYSCEGDDAKVGFVRSICGGWNDTALFQRATAPEPMAGTEERSYSVTYTAGYVLPKDGASTLPPEIEEACLLTCVATYRAKGRDPGIASESLLNASVSYVGSTVNTGIGRGLGGIIPDPAVALLAPFRRWV